MQRLQGGDPLIEAEIRGKPVPDALPVERVARLRRQRDDDVVPLGPERFRRMLEEDEPRQVTNSRRSNRRRTLVTPFRGGASIGAA